MRLSNFLFMFFLLCTVKPSSGQAYLSKAAQPNPDWVDSTPDDASIELAFAEADTGTVSDSSGGTQSQSAEALLPESMGPMETVIWGRHGMVHSWFGRPLNAETREGEMHLRRVLLSAHQIFGLATFASLLTTVYYGQRMYNSQDFSSRHTHRELAFLSIGTYSVTALLALATPPPLVRRKQWSSVSTHKALAWAHLTGLIVTPAIGLMIKNSTTPRKLERFHLASAYLTTATFGASILVLTF